MKTFQVLSTLAFFMLANSMPHGMSSNEIAARSLSGNLLATTILSKRTETPLQKEARLQKEAKDRKDREDKALRDNEIKKVIPVSIDPSKLKKTSGDNLRGKSGTSDDVKKAEAAGTNKVPLKKGGK